MRKKFNDRDLGPALAILTADTHLRDTTPECRTDDFREAMLQKLRFIKTLQYTCGDIPVLCSGDLFDYWKPSPELLAESITLLDNWIVVPGQHDLKNHNMGLLSKTGLAVLSAAKKVTVLTEVAEWNVRNVLRIIPFPWGTPPVPVKFPTSDKLSALTVVMIHGMVYEDGHPPYPGAEKEGWEAGKVLKAFPKADIILTGDNHAQFVYQKDGKGPILVNPGPMMRTVATQEKFQPKVFLLHYSKEGKAVVVPVNLPIEPGVVSREHLNEKEERDNRVTAFIEGLKAGVEMGVNYRENLTRFLAKNQVTDGVKDLVWKAVERG